MSFFLRPVGSPPPPKVYIDIMNVGPCHQNVFFYYCLPFWSSLLLWSSLLSAEAVAVVADGVDDPSLLPWTSLSSSCCCFAVVIFVLLLLISRFSTVGTFILLLIHAIVVVAVIVFNIAWLSLVNVFRAVLGDFSLG